VELRSDRSFDESTILLNGFSTNAVRGPILARINESELVNAPDIKRIGMSGRIRPASTASSTPDIPGI
jgi:hypothetical protein